MEKLSTQPSLSSRTSPHPRRVTIERLRQLARATFATPVGTPVVLN